MKELWKNSNVIVIDFSAMQLINRHYFTRVLFFLLNFGCLHNSCLLKYSNYTFSNAINVQLSMDIFDRHLVVLCIGVFQRGCTRLKSHHFFVLFFLEVKCTESWLIPDQKGQTLVHNSILQYRRWIYLYLATGRWLFKVFKPCKYINLANSTLLVWDGPQLCFCIFFVRNSASSVFRILSIH